MSPLVLALLLACGGNKQAPADEPAPPAAPAPAPTDEPAPVDPPPPADPGELVGAWSGAPCGAREYERWLTLTEGGTWSAEDRISPCPEGVQCVWSGIVRSSGTWEVDGTTLALTEDKADGAQGQPRPTVFAVGATEDEAVGTESEAECPYTRREVAAEPEAEKGGKPPR